MGKKQGRRVDLTTKLAVVPVFGFIVWDLQVSDIVIGYFRGRYYSCHLLGLTGLVSSKTPLINHNFLQVHFTLDHENILTARHWQLNLQL